MALFGLPTIAPLLYLKFKSVPVNQPQQFPQRITHAPYSRTHGRSPARPKTAAPTDKH